MKCVDICFENTAVHEKKKPLSCHLCDLAFAQPSQLKTHLEGKHRMHYEVFCSIYLFCNKAFHVKMKHHSLNLIDLTFAEARQLKHIIKVLNAVGFVDFDINFGINSK